jgi:hypothetical protein
MGIYQQFEKLFYKGYPSFDFQLHGIVYCMQLCMQRLHVMSDLSQKLLQEGLTTHGMKVIMVWIASQTFMNHGNGIVYGSRSKGYN